MGGVAGGEGTAEGGHRRRTWGGGGGQGGPYARLFTGPDDLGSPGRPGGQVGQAASRAGRWRPREACSRAGTSTRLGTAAVGRKARACAAGVVQSARSGRLRRSAAALSGCLLATALVLSVPVIVAANYLSLVCTAIRVEQITTSDLCDVDVVVDAAVAVRSHSRFPVWIDGLNATLISGRAVPVASLSVNGDFHIRRGWHTFDALVGLSLLDAEELFRALRGAAAAFDQATQILRQPNVTDADGEEDLIQPELPPDVDGGWEEDEEEGVDKRANAGNASAGGGAGNATAGQRSGEGASSSVGPWHVHIAMDVGTSIFGTRFQTPLAFTAELSREAAARMRRVITRLQSFARCSVRDGLDFSANTPHFRTWPPVLDGMEIKEVSHEGLHVAGTVQLNMSGALAHMPVPALSVQICSAPDEVLPTEPVDDRLGDTDAALAAREEQGAGEDLAGLGRASGVIQRHVSSASEALNETEVQAYVSSHSAKFEGCLGTIAMQPFTVSNEEPFAFSFDLAMPFYGNSSERFYGPLHFAEELSRGGAFIARGSTDAEIGLLAGRTFSDTYFQQGRATSACLLQRLLQGVSFRAHLLRMLPSAGPYIKDALLGASCMAGVFLHYFSHDNTTQLNDDRVLEDCFAFFEGTVGLGLDPARPSKQRRARPPKPIEVTFRPAPRDATGRLLYHFTQANASAVESACRWLHGTDDSNHYHRARGKLDGITACEELCLSKPDCWGLEFEMATGHCELWNRQPRATVAEEGFRCLVLEPEGTAFPPEPLRPAEGGGGGSEGGMAVAPDSEEDPQQEQAARQIGLDDGWEEAKAGARAAASREAEADPADSTGAKGDSTS